MKNIFWIFKYKLKSFLRNDIKIKDIFPALAGSIIYILFFVGIYQITKTFLSTLLIQYKLGTFLLHQFLSSILFIVFVTINIGNIIVSYSTIYKSKELNFLFTKPIKEKNIFIVKFLDNFFYSSATLLVFLLSVLIGYASFFNYGFNFYLISILLFVPFTFIAALLGTIILFLFIKLASTIGFRITIFLIAIFYAISIFIYFNINNPFSLVEQVFRNYPNLNIYIKDINNGITRFLPNNWVAEGLYWFNQNNMTNVLSAGFLLILLALILFWINYKIAEKFYFKSYFLALDLKYHKNNFIHLNFKRRNNKNLKIGLIEKDNLLFFREPTQTIHLVLMLSLIVIFIVSINGIQNKILTGIYPELKLVLYIVLFSFNTFLIASLSLRFIYPMISLEGETFWKLKSSPIKLKHYFLKKFSIAFLILLVISESLNYFTHSVIFKEMIVSSSINNFFITLTIVSISFSFGSIFPNFKEKNAIRIASSQGASISFLTTLIYLVLVVAILYKPLELFFLQNNFFYFENIFNLIFLLITILSLISFTILIILINKFVKIEI
ncbi:MAG: hypothetical protein STSR0008_05650 [Ignavibacterium sp.]